MHSIPDPVRRHARSLARELMAARRSRPSVPAPVKPQRQLSPLVEHDFGEIEARAFASRSND